MNNQKSLFIKIYIRKPNPIVGGIIFLKSTFFRIINNKVKYITKTQAEQHEALNISPEE